MMDQHLAWPRRRVSDHFAIEIFYIAIIPLKYSSTLELQFTILNQTRVDGQTGLIGALCHV